MGRPRTRSISLSLKYPEIYTNGGNVIHLDTWQPAQVTVVVGGGGGVSGGLGRQVPGKRYSVPNYFWCTVQLDHRVLTPTFLYA
jgi:hypothetical protein